MSQVPPAISPTLPTNHRTISRYISNQAPTSVTIDPADASYDTTLIKDTHLEDSNIVNNTTQTYSVVKGPFKALNNDSTRSRNFNREHSSETDPLLPRNEREGHYRRPLDTCPTWWVELRTIVSYALPVLGAQCLEYSLSSVPIISIGHISTIALAAGTLGNMTAIVSGLSVIQGFGAALDTMLPSAWTSKTPSHVGLWSQRMFVLMNLLLIPIIITWINAEKILLLLKQDPEVAYLAGLYLRWFCLGIPAYAYNNILRRYFQSQGLFDAPIYITMIVAPINILLNYLLVWGPEKIRLGFIGAPIATSISFNLITFLYLIYGCFIAPQTAWQPFSSKAFTEIGLLFRLGVAGFIQNAAEWWSWEGVALAASQIGPAALAVQSVLLVSASTTYQVPSSLGTAACVRIGNLLGAENPREAALAAQVAVLLAFIAAFILSTIYMVFRDSWGYIFNNDIEVIRQVALIMPLMALSGVFDGLASVTGGIMRAKGQQEVGAILNIITYYVIGLPIGVLLAFKYSMGLSGLWVGLTIAAMGTGFYGVYNCLILSDWEFEMQKASRRLERDHQRPINSLE